MGRVVLLTCFALSALACAHAPKKQVDTPFGPAPDAAQKHAWAQDFRRVGFSAPKDACPSILADDLAYALVYSADTLEARFVGDRLALNVHRVSPQPQVEGPPLLNVFVDGNLLAVVPVVAAKPSVVEVVTKMRHHAHHLRITRRSERHMGCVVVDGFWAGPQSQSLAPPPQKARLVSVIGDSISCGYGNLCGSLGHGLSSKEEDATKTYGYMAAEALGADVEVLAWSGKGLIKNGDGSTTATVKNLVDDMLNLVPPPSYRAGGHAIVINLGTNDLRNTQLNDADFVAAYVGLIQQLDMQYRASTYFVTMGPMLQASDHRLARALAMQKKIVDHFFTTTKIKVLALVLQMQEGDWGFGCDYHPTVKQHIAMATQLQLALREEMKW